MTQAGVSLGGLELHLSFFLTAYETAGPKRRSWPLFAVKSLSLQADRVQWTVAGAGLELGMLNNLPSWGGGWEQI
ncbi:MAG: hypothetical protein U5L00_19930 [Desulfovermiculus sp.]|nr:hypothetical protein [Desulfovermiculus sp.]